MGKTHKDQSKWKKIGGPSVKQKDPGKKVRLEDFMDTDLEDSEVDCPNSSHSLHEHS